MFKTTMAIAESEIEVHLLGNKFQLLHDKVSAVENELEKNAKAASDSNGVEQSEDGEGKSSTFADPLGEDFETKIVEDILEIDADAAMSLIEEYSERLTQKIEERSKVLEEAGECLERAKERSQRRHCFCNRTQGKVREAGCERKTCHHCNIEYRR